MPYTKRMKKRKTSVYLRPEELKALKQISIASGISQAFLIREGVQAVLKKYRLHLKG